MYHTVVSCPLAHMAISSGEVYSWNKTFAYVYTTYVQKDKILVPNSLYVQKRVFSSPDISAAYHAPHCYFACYLNQLLADQFVIFINNTNVQIKQHV